MICKNLPCAILLLLLASACGTKPAAGVKVPAHILSEEKFTKLLTDFALAESAANLNIKNVPFQRVDTAYAFDPLAENHVTKLQYDSAIAFYSAHPELYKKVYDNVLAALSDMQMKRDSIRAKDSTSK